MKKKNLVFCFVFLVFAFVATAHAEFGIQADLNKFKDSDSTDTGIGARIMTGAAGIGFIGSFDYYFLDQNEPGNPKFYEVNANLTVTIPTVVVHPYFGGGLNVSRFSVSDNAFSDSMTKSGINILGGVKFSAGAIEPFGEVRYVIYKGEETFNDRLVLTGGILF